jgi:hypothetical protein
MVGSARVSMILESQSDASAPRLLEIVWREASNVRFVRVSCRQDILDSAISAAAFRPETLLPTHRDRVAAKPQLAERRPKPLNPALLEATQVDALAVLHNLGLCMQGDLQVQPTNQSESTA